MTTVNTPAEIQNNVENLAKFVSILEEAHAQIVVANSELEAESENLPDIVASLENSITNLERSLGNLQQQWNDADISLNAAQESVAQFIIAAEEQLEPSLESLEATANSFQSEFNADRQALAENISEVQNDFVELEEVSSNWEESLLEVKETTQNVFNEVEDSLAQFKETVDTFQSETESDFEGLISDLVEQYNPDLTNLMNECSNTLSEDYLNQMLTDFDTFQTAAINLYGTFNSDITNLGISFQRQGISLINSCIEYCLESLGKEMKSVFDEAIDKIVEELTEELVETTLTMTIGATTTSIMTPILPELVIAKKLVAAINAAKDILNPFD